MTDYNKMKTKDLKIIRTNKNKRLKSSKTKAKAKTKLRKGLVVINAILKKRAR